jgi:hypothetical protein
MDCVGMAVDEYDGNVMTGGLHRDVKSGEDVKVINEAELTGKLSWRALLEGDDESKLDLTCVDATIGRCVFDRRKVAEDGNAPDDTSENGVNVTDWFDDTTGRNEGVICRKEGVICRKEGVICRNEEIEGDFWSSEVEDGEDDNK